MKSKIILLVLLLVFSNNIFSQITGTVVDKYTGRPIENVNIKKKGTLKGTTSNSKGYFSTNLLNQKDTIVVSHIAYLSRILIVDKLSTTIELTLSQTLLNEAEIYSKKEAVKILGNPWIIDYHIINDSSLIIAKIGNLGSQLQIITNSKKSKNYNLYNIENITESCLNHIYIQTSDTSYKVEIINKELVITSYLMNNDLLEICKSCKIKHNEKQYFTSLKANGKLSCFYVFKSGHLNPVEFYKIFDKAGYLHLVSVNYQYASLEKITGSVMGDIYPGHPDPEKNSGLIFKKLSLEGYLKFLKNIAITSSLLVVNDSLIIVDNVNDEIVFFNNDDTFKKATPFNHSLKKEKIIHILQDRITEQIYYFAEENNKINIYHLDIYSGKFKSVLTMNRHIEEPKIYKGILYYLQYDMHKDSRELYKIPL